MKSKQKKKLDWTDQWCLFVGGASIAGGLILLPVNTLISMLLMVTGVHLTIWGYRE